MRTVMGRSSKTARWALAVAGLVTASALAGCTGAELEGRVADRVTTTLDPATVPAGTSAAVICTVLGPEGHLVTEGETTFAVTPEEGWSSDEASVTPTVAGEYQVACASPTFNLVDPVGATLTVVPGPAVKVTTILDAAQIRVHETTGVNCVATDVYGNVIEGAASTVTADEAVTVDGHTVGSEVVGTHQVTCALDDAPDVEQVPASLEVQPGDPAEVELVAKPSKNDYDVGDNVTISWIVRDQWGNEIPDVPGTLSSPLDGLTVVNEEDHRFRFNAEGLYTWSVTLDGTWAHLTDDLTLVCDDTGPQIVIKFPERGATLKGDGAPIEIVGTVVDELSEIAQFNVNGEKIVLGADGTFKVPMTPAWGLNVIFADARDVHGNDSKVTPTYHYSADYVSFVDESAVGVKQDDALALLIGQAFLDDGDHDHEHPNDLATLLELIIGELDVTSLLGSGPLFEQSMPILDQQLLDLGIVSLSLSGDLNISAEIINTPEHPTGFGNTYVTIDSRTGGIDTIIEIGDVDEKGLSLSILIKLELALTAEWSALGTSGTQQLATATAEVYSGLSIDSVLVQTALDIDLPPGGEPFVDLKDLDLELVNLEIDPIDDITFTLNVDLPIVGGFDFEVNLSDFFDLSALTDAILDPLTTQLIPMFVNTLEPLVEQFADDVLLQLFSLLELDLSFPLPELLGPKPEPIELDIYTNLTSIAFTDDGGTIGMSLGIYADKGVDRNPLGAIQREGCLVGLSDTFDYSWEKSIGLAAKTDAVNGALFGVWWSGFLDGPLDLGALMGGGGGGLGGLPIDDLALDLQWLLPPVLNDCGDGNVIEVQIGDLFADVTLSIITIDVDAEIFADLGLAIRFEMKEDGLYVIIEGLTFLDVEVISITDEVSDFFDVKDLLENQLDSLLGGFIDGQELGPLALPAFDLGTLLPGLPAGAAIELGDLGLTKEEGYLVIGGNLK